MSTSDYNTPPPSYKEKEFDSFSNHHLNHQQPQKHTNTLHTIGESLAAIHATVQKTRNPCFLVSAVGTAVSSTFNKGQKLISKHN
ncbi:unnamed protein product [Cunninghamella blakesleeana]